MSVGRVCNREVSLAEASETVAAAARRMAEQRVGSLVVRACDARPIGIVTDRDLVRRVLARGLDPSITRVGSIMTPRPCTVSEDAPIEAALGSMRAHRIRRLIVVDAEGALVGMLSLDDVLALLAEEMTTVGHLLAQATSDRGPREIPKPAWATTRATQPIGRADLEHQFRDAMRRRLRERREAIFRVVADAEEDLRFIAEDRESELVEQGQEEAAARLLARLDARGKEAIEEIDAALVRLASGAYGKCFTCNRSIGYARLQALPAAKRCAECAREAEVERRSQEI